jgi:hypothetical protein
MSPLNTVFTKQGFGVFVGVKAAHKHPKILPSYVKYGRVFILCENPDCGD